MKHTVLLLTLTLISLLLFIPGCEQCQQRGLVRHCTGLNAAAAPVQSSPTRTVRPTPTRTPSDGRPDDSVGAQTTESRA